jgi:predicted phosphodiesterase
VQGRAALLALLLLLLLPACQENASDPSDEICRADPGAPSGVNAGLHRPAPGRAPAGPTAGATPALRPALAGRGAGPTDARARHRPASLAREAAGAAGPGEREPAGAPRILQDGLAALGPAARVGRPEAAPRTRFSFAVISDTHEAVRCALGQGRWLLPAIAYLNRRRPAFVVALGDLVAGGGDCDLAPRAAGWGSTQDQLAELKRELIDRLEVPLVPVAGNHDLSVEHSRRATGAKASWRRFWRDHAGAVLPAARAGDPAGHHRFTHRGVGLALLAHEGDYGPSAAELAWIDRTVRPGDLVFRHVGPYGLSCTPEGFCGGALRGYGRIDPADLPEHLQRAGARALFSGHSHAFYDGVCDGLRYVNTGTLAGRALETLAGWHRSPGRFRQAFVWVDVLEDGNLRVTLLVWSPERERFEALDKRELPARLRSRREARPGYDEGVNATCLRPAAARR